MPNPHEPNPEGNFTSDAQQDRAPLEPGAPADVAPQVAITQDQIDAGVDLIHRTALGTAKILLLEHGDVPRLLVSASCRSLEQLMEFYAKTRESQDVTGRARLQLQIHTLAGNLKGALVEALDMTEKVIASLPVVEEEPK